MISSAIGMDRVCELIFGMEWHRISPKTLARSRRFARESRRNAEKERNQSEKRENNLFARAFCIMRWFLHTKCIPNTRNSREKRTSSRYIRIIAYNIPFFNSSSSTAGARAQGRNRLNGSIYERLSLLPDALKWSWRVLLALARLSCFLNFILSHTFQSFLRQPRSRSILLGARSSVLVLFSPFDTSLVSIARRRKKELATGSLGRDPQFQFPIIIIFNAPLGTWIFSGFDFDRDFCFNFPSFSLSRARL